ncbi:MAG: ABC transporter substrate-binding protein [Chloroflexi bacterium]|nr:ABC transporter substrate-binding protein [Chloroflexota bacterium]
MSKRGLLVIGALLVALVVGACAPAAPTPVKEETVKLGVTGYMSDAGHYIAIEKGYMTEQGIKVELERFDSGAKIVAALSAGQLQVGSGGPSVGLYNAIIRGLPIKVVADTGLLTKGHDPNWISLRPALKDKVKSVADLKGKKVAFPAPGSILDYMMGKTLEKNGLTMKDIEVVSLPPPDYGPALERGAIDVAVPADPVAADMEKRGQAIRWFRSNEYVKDPYNQVSILMYNSDWAKTNQDAARRYMIAFMKAVRDFNRAMERAPIRAEVVGILTKNLAVKDPKIYDEVEWGEQNPDGFVSKESIADQVDWFFRNGAITEKIPVSKIVDDSFADYAVKKLGKYKK